jgi:hypothetical protein
MRCRSAPTAIIVLAVFSLTTPVFAQTQAIQIKTICVDGSPVIDATCSLTIGQQQSSLITPGTTTVPKSLDDLMVSCVKGNTSATGQFSSRRSGGLWGKLAAWGGMDQILDWKDLDQLDYPKEMTVVLAGDCAK